MVTVDGLGGADGVLIQHARLRLPGDLGRGAGTRDHDLGLSGELGDLACVCRDG
jgi:hypothetical protein